MPIKRHPKIMSCYQGGILNTWYDFQILQNRQYIVSSGFLKTNSKKYSDFFCIFFIKKIRKKKIIRYFFLKYGFQILLPIMWYLKIMSCYQSGILNTWHDFESSKNRQYIVSSGFFKTYSKEYTDFYPSGIFSIRKNLKKNLINFPIIWVSQIIAN